MIDDLLRTAALDCRPSVGELKFSDLKRARSSWMEDALTGGKQANLGSNPFGTLRYLELCAKALDPSVAKPESSIPAFLASQISPPTIHAKEPHIKMWRDLWSFHFGGRVSEAELASGCRHGPGATSDRLSSYDKWLSAVPSSVAETLDPLNRLPHVAPQLVSKYYDVPKTAWKNRGICAESTSDQFVQQGISRQLEKRLLPFVDIRKQSRNREMCQRECFHTIDLSSASDSISTELISLLGDTAPDDIVSLMWAYRSVFTSIDGELVLNSTFASMGNGFCFSLLTTVVVSLCLLTICQAYRIPMYNRRESYKLFRQLCSVYGDDIVVHEDLDLHLRRNLELFGFSLNSSKSSFRSRLNESCGTFVLDGIVVSDIVRVRDASLSSLDSVVHMCDIQRRLYKASWSHTSDFLCREILSACSKLGIPVIHFSNDLPVDLEGSLSVSSSSGLILPVYSDKRRFSPYVRLPRVAYATRDVELCGGSSFASSLFWEGLPKRISPEVTGRSRVTMSRFY